MVKNNNARFLSRLLGIVVLLSGLSSAHGGDPTDDLYRQMDAMGIRLGMTISEARAVVVPQGGEVRLFRRPNQPLTLKVVQLMDSKQYFEYVATPIPMPERPITPGPRRPKNPVPTVTPDYYVNLYVYPKTKGRWDDPDNLVIYALRTSRAFSGGIRPFGVAPAAGEAPSVTPEEFLRLMADSYGPVRELITGSVRSEFAFLPDVKTGKSFSAADIKAAPLDNNKARLDTTRCAYMGHQVHRMYQLNLKLSLDPKMSSLVAQKGLAGYVAADPRMAPGTYEAWGWCGEVTHVQAPLNPRNQSEIAQINLFRYSRDHYERAMKAFAKGM